MRKTFSYLLPAICSLFLLLTLSQLASLNVNVKELYEDHFFIDQGQIFNIIIYVTFIVDANLLKK